MIPIKSALSVVRHLLPFATSGPLPLLPKIPDFGSVLSEIGSMIQGILGGGETQPEERETEENPASGPIDVREPIPFREDPAPEFSRAERVGYRTEADRPRPEASVEETPAEPTIEESLNSLEELRRRAGLYLEPAETPDEALPPPLPLLPETALEELERMQPLPPVSLPPPVASAHALAVLNGTVALESTGVPQDRVNPVGRSLVDARAGGESRPAGPASPVQAARAADPAGLVDRIVKAARLTQSRGMARIKISLSPAHLGELKIDLSVRQHVLHGTLQADNAAAKDLLLAHLNTLREALEQQGIQVGEFQVSVDQSFQQASQDPQHSGGSGYSTLPETEEIPAHGEGPVASGLQLFDVVV